MVIEEFFYSILGGISDNINLSGRKHANGGRLTATADCLYPYNPMVNVQYREQVKFCNTNPL